MAGGRISAFGASKGRLLVDISTSWHLAGAVAVGMLRRERELARRLLIGSPFPVLPVVFQDDKIYALEADYALALLSEPSQFTSVVVSQPINASRRQVVNKLKMLGQKLTVRILREVAFFIFLATPMRVHADLAKALQHSRLVLINLVSRLGPAFLNKKRSLRKIPSPDQYLKLVVHPLKHDVIWTCGLYSHFVPLRRISEEKIRRGFKVASVCYDLSHIRYPQWNHRDMSTDVFVANAVDLLDASDVVFCISDYVRDDLRKFSNEIGRNIPNLRRINLGADLQSLEHEGSQANSLRPKKLYALAVGAVEARKNYELLLRIWKIFSLDTQMDMELIIVGKEGFQSERNGDNIRSAIAKMDQIRWLQHVSDSQLDDLYRGACVFLCPSLHEGWALPVTEALAVGCSVIFSNRGALPEAGHGLATLLDPDDQLSWEAAIRQAARGQLSQSKLIDIPTWDNSVKLVRRDLETFMIASESIHENSATQQPLDA